MAILSLFLLLAAYISTVTSGPVPRRQLFTSYANTTSTAISTIETAQPSSVAAGSSSTFFTSAESLTPLPSTQVLSLPTSPYPSPSIPESSSSSLTAYLVNAETAVIIVPIQPTVIEHTIPAITFINPSGEPIVTQALEVLSSTSFITPPAPTSKTEHTSSATPTPSNSYEEQSTTSSNKSKKPTSSSSNLSSTLSSSLAVAESDSPSQSSFKLPTFTYSPEEDETSTSLASSTKLATTKTSSSPTASATGTIVPSSSEVPISSAAPVSSAAPISSTVPSLSTATGLLKASTTGASSTLRSSGLPGFSFNATGSQDGDVPKSSTYVSVIRSSSVTQSAAKSSSLPIFESSGVLTPPVITGNYPTSIPSGVTASTTKTSLVVTKTVQITVVPTPSTSAPPSLVPTLSSSVAYTSSFVSGTSSVIQEAISSLSLTSNAGVTLTTFAPSQNAISTSSTVATLPSTPLVPPPVVIVTQYTTTTPPATPLPSSTLKTPSSSVLLEPMPVSPTSSSVYSTLLLSSTGSTSILTPTPSVSISKPAPSSNTPSTLLQSSSIGYASLPAVTSVASTTTEMAPTSTSVLGISTTEGPLIITPIPPSQIFTITVTEKETVTETATVTVTA